MLIIPPPLPPHKDVLRLNFASKQNGFRSWFFKAQSNHELQRWLADLRWRTVATDGQLGRRYEPEVKRYDVPQRRLDETELAVDRQPETVFGMVVRYNPKPPPEGLDVEEEKKIVIKKKKEDDNKKKVKSY